MFHWIQLRPGATRESLRRPCARASSDSRKQFGSCQNIRRMCLTGIAAPGRPSLPWPQGGLGRDADPLLLCLARNNPERSRAKS